MPQGAPCPPLAPTAPGFRASLEAFEQVVDPDGVLSPVERTRRAEEAFSAYRSQRRRGAYIQQSLYDAREITAAARRAFDDRFERQVDPEGILTKAERRRRAEAARRAYFIELSRRGNAVLSARRRGSWR